MATFGQRVQRSAQAAMSAWRNDTPSNYSFAQPDMYVGVDAEHKERVARYKLLWKYYSGEHKHHLKARQTPTGAGPDDNVTINLSRRVVNKGATFLFGEPVDTDSDSDSEQPAVTQSLNAAWQSVEWRMGFLNELAINGGVTGDFYIQLIPPETPLDAPRIVNINPSIVIPHINPDDVDEVWEYELRWRSRGKIKRTRYMLGEDEQSWDIVSEILAGPRWVLDPDNAPEVWPYSWAPILHGKNLPNPNSFFGLSDLEDADLNDAINSVTSNMNRIIRLFAHPVLWGKKFSATDLDISKIAMSQDKDAMLGALELARDVSGAQEFNRYLRTMHSETTEVPSNDPDRLAIGAQSGFALKVLFHELVQKTNIKRALYGREIVELNRRIVELSGHGPKHYSKLYWRSPLPTDEAERVISDTFDLDFGLASKQTVATRRGYDWAAEQERMAGEKDKKPSMAFSQQ